MFWKQKSKRTGSSTKIKNDSSTKVTWVGEILIKDIRGYVIYRYSEDQGCLVPNGKSNNLNREWVWYAYKSNTGGFAGSGAAGTVGNTGVMSNVVLAEPELTTKSLRVCT